MKKDFPSQIDPRQVIAVLFFGSALLTQTVHADLVYDSGPILSQPNGLPLFAGPSSAEFTLAGSTPLAEAVITVYSPTPVTSPLPYTYTIEQTLTSPFLSSGPVNLNLSPLGTLGSDYLYQTSFAVGGSYAAGSYFLSLSNSASPFQPRGSLYWQTCDQSGTVASLQLYSTTVIPEPADIPWLTGSAALLGTGVLVLRNRKKSQPRA